MVFLKAFTTLVFFLAVFGWSKWMVHSDSFCKQKEVPRFHPGLDLGLFESIKAGYGESLRVIIDKYSRTNHSFDYGLGEKSSGFYLAVPENFYIL